MRNMPSAPNIKHRELFETGAGEVWKTGNSMLRDRQSLEASRTTFVQAIFEEGFEKPNMPND